MWTIYFSDDELNGIYYLTNDNNTEKWNFYTSTKTGNNLRARLHLLILC